MQDENGRKWAQLQKGPPLCRDHWKGHMSREFFSVFVYFFRDSTEILQPAVYDTTIFQELMKNRPAGPRIARGGKTEVFGKVPAP